MYKAGVDIIDLPGTRADNAVGSLRRLETAGGGGGGAEQKINSHLPSAQTRNLLEIHARMARHIKNCSTLTVR